MTDEQREEINAVLHSLQADGTVDRGRIADLIRALSTPSGAQPTVGTIGHVSHNMPVAATLQSGAQQEAVAKPAQVQRDVLRRAMTAAWGATRSPVSAYEQGRYDAAIEISRLAIHTGEQQENG